MMDQQRIGASDATLAASGRHRSSAANWGAEPHTDALQQGIRPLARRLASLTGRARRLTCTLTCPRGPTARPWDGASQRL